MEKKEVNKPRKKEHLQIARFLIKNFLPYCEKHKYKFEINLEAFLKAIYDSYKKTQDDIAEQYTCKIQESGLEEDVSQSKISRAIGKINEKLQVFCQDHNIDPPIQMFSYYINPINQKRVPFGFFLACAKPHEKNDNTVVSIVRFDQINRVETDTSSIAPNKILKLQIPQIDIDPNRKN